MSALALGLSVGTAYADPDFVGIFEAPLVEVAGSAGDCDNVAGTECDGSEAKIGSDGSWKVEVFGIPDDGGDNDGPFDICLVQAGVGDTTLAEDVPKDEDDDLEASDGDGIFVPDGTHESVVIVVRAGDGVADTNECTDNDLFSTGLYTDDGM